MRVRIQKMASPAAAKAAERLRLARPLCLPRRLRTVTATWNHGSFGKKGQIIRTVRAVTLPHQNVPWSSDGMPATRLPATSSPRGSRPLSLDRSANWPAVHIRARLMETVPPSATNTW